MTSSTACAGAMRTSATVWRNVYGLNPSPDVRFDCGSMSTARTRRPRSAKAPASAAHVVVLPTPPFPATHAMDTTTACASVVSSSEAADARRRCWCGDLPDLVETALHEAHE